MRPILMMTLSACIGLLPAAISTGIGSQVQRPLATVIVGGMLIGPIMLLVVVPALQTLFLGWERAARIRGRAGCCLELMLSRIYSWHISCIILSRDWRDRRVST